MPCVVFLMLFCCNEQWWIYTPGNAVHHEKKCTVFILYLLSKASWYWLLAYQYTYFYLTDLLEGTLIFKVLKEETFSDTSFLSYHWERNRNKWLEILNASNNLQKEECYRNLEGIFNLIWNYILNTCTNKNTMEKKRLAGHDIQQDNSNLKYKNIWIEIYGNLFIQKLNC